MGGEDESARPNWGPTMGGPMGLGSTARKLSSLSELAEKLYSQVSDLRERVGGLERDLEATRERVDAIDAETRRQRALLEAIAEEQGVDVAAVLDGVDDEPPGAADEGPDATASADAPADGSGG